MSQVRENEIREQVALHWVQAEETVRAFVFSVVKDFHDAEDVVQDIALSVARRYPEYDPSKPFTAWALWMAKSRIIDHYRKQCREKMKFSDAMLDQIADAMIQRQPVLSERQIMLEACLDKLPPKSRRMLDLRYVEGQSIESLAQIVNSTAGTVRVMLFRLRDKLENCVRMQLAREERH